MSEIETSQGGLVHLDINSIGAWMSSRPSLLRAFLASGQPMDSASCSNLIERIEQGRSGVKSVIAAVCEDQEGTIALGRPGRFRLMAWMADAEKDTLQPLLPVLIGDTKSSTVEIPSPISKLFHDDLLKFATNVIAPQSELTLSDPMVVAALEAGLETLTNSPAPTEPTGELSPENSL